MIGRLWPSSPRVAAYDADGRPAILALAGFIAFLMHCSAFSGIARYFK